MQDKVVVITGASSGIGLACAKEFASRKYSVVLAARNIQKLTEIENEIKVSNPNILVVPTDVTKEEDCKNLIDATIGRFKTIDILINNAGISMRALFETVDLKVIKQLMDVNFWGAVYCTKYALPFILKNKGSVVGVSSIAGYKGLPARTGYSASKFALQGFLDTLRVENLKNDLHVMIVAPGFTASNIRKTALDGAGHEQGESPLEEGNLMSAEEVAVHIYKGIQRRKRSIVLTLQGKLVLLFNKFCPRLLDIMEYNTMRKEPNSPLK
ncbi:MAG TPA: SDR family oxidoreductase [Bacteroidales bacterium]|nr:SDR family oxidoreductase [Bacteroidales bacterium]